MFGNGYYIVEYNYRDKRGHLLTRREMRGTFDLVIKVYKELSKKVKDNDPKAPIKSPRLLYVVDGLEREIKYKEELKRWQNSK